MMNWRKHFLEGATLVAAAVLCALVANAMAGRERKMALVGTYPNALKVPVEDRLQPVQPAATVTTSTVPAVIPVPTPTTSTTSTRDRLKPVLHTPKPAPIVVQAEQFPAHPDKAYVEIGFDSVHQLYQRKVLFLDARRTSVYEQGHIAGARSFSVWESDIDDKVNKLFEERGDPRQQAEPIVIYCSGGDCEDSHMLAQKLWGIQYNNVYVYKDGFPDWSKRGGAVHTGANP
jgi:rhodanese-related sulfurtransferase